jgi:hypothetical protein
MRLKASIWIGAYIRRLGAMAIPAMVLRRGDGDAGAIYIKINTLDGFAMVLRPAATGIIDSDIERFWSPAMPGGRAEENAADAYLARQAGFDSDMWVIEVEDRAGRHFLDEFLISE